MYNSQVSFDLTPSLKLLQGCYTYTQQIDAQVRGELKQYGNIVNGRDTEQREHFIKLLIYWWQNNSKSPQFTMMNSDIITAYIATPILKYITTHDVNQSLAQRMFNEIWCSLDQVGRNASAINKATQGLEEVAHKFFGKNGAFDVTDVNALYILNTALNKHQSAKYNSVENENALANTVLESTKETILYWSQIENMKKLPVSDRQLVIKYAEYLKSSEHDKEQNNSDHTTQSKSTKPNMFSQVRKNLARADHTTLDADYVTPSGEPRPYGYYSLDMRMRLADVMPNTQGTQYLSSIAFLCGNDKEAQKLYSQIIDRTENFFMRHEYIIKFIELDTSGIYKGIDDEHEILAYNIANGKISAEMIRTMPKSQQQIATLILSRCGKIEELKAILGDEPLSRASTELSRTVLSIIAEHGSKQKDADSLLYAIDMILKSQNHAVSAQQLLDSVKALKQSATSKEQATKNKYFSAINTTIDETVLNDYIARLEKAVQQEKLSQVPIKNADPAIAKPVLTQFVATLNGTALRKAPLSHTNSH